MNPPRSFYIYGWLRLLAGCGAIVAAGLLKSWPATIACIALYAACWWRLSRIIRRAA